MFRKAAAGELAEDSGLNKLAALTDVDVAQVGVGGAASFFESKVCFDTQVFISVPSRLFNLTTDNRSLNLVCLHFDRLVCLQIDLIYATCWSIFAPSLF